MLQEEEEEGLILVLVMELEERHVSTLIWVDHNVLMIISCKTMDENNWTSTICNKT